MSHKEAYYFSHDSNARNDTKILSMRSVYGAEGYGWYWIIVEMLREQKDYKIKLGKYVWNALAMQMQCNADAAHKYVQDCINEFDLFVSDGEYFWSESLVKRMKTKEDKSEKAKRAAEARWNKPSNGNGSGDSKKGQESSNADAMQTHSDRNAIKEKKVKESKRKESKDKYADFVALTKDEHQKLLDQFGENLTNDYIERLNLYKGSTGKKYKSDYMTILNWSRKDTTNQPSNVVRMNARQEKQVPRAYQSMYDWLKEEEHDQKGNTGFAVNSYS